ncbi:MAG: HDOD domain-containing protein [Burkholderiales bacterium]
MGQESAILDREAQQVLADICIPPCPAILTKLMQEMRADEPDFPRISKLIGSDASIAAAMLQTVNSPFYGLRNPAASVQQAVALLGLRNVVQMVTGLLLRNTFSGGSSELMEDYWESSSTIAQINAVLARQLKGFDRDEAYTFALFRDCGMLAMMDGYQDYQPVFPGVETRDGVDITAIENEQYKMDHARVGYNLAKMWLLPEDICQSVLWHHDYAVLRAGQAGIPLKCAKHIALALLAEWIFVKQTMGIESPEWRKGGEFARELLAITDEDMDSALEQIGQDAAIFG